MALPMTSSWSPTLVDMGAIQHLTNAKTAAHDHGSTEEVGGRSKPCSP